MQFLCSFIFSHILNFDKLIEEVEQKLQRKSEETLREESSVYKVNIDDLENGLEIWNEKCNQAKGYLKECLIERNNIIKSIEQVLVDTGNLKISLNGLNCVNGSTHNTENQTVKHTSGSKELLNPGRKTIISKTRVDTVSNNSDKLTTSTSHMPTGLALEYCEPGNSNNDVLASMIFKPPENKAETEKNFDKTKLCCNISIPGNILREEPIHINLLTCKVETSENIEHEGFETRNKRLFEESVTHKPKPASISETSDNKVPDLNKRSTERASRCEKESIVIADEKLLSQCNQLKCCSDASTQTDRNQFSNNNETNNVITSHEPYYQYPSIIPFGNHERKTCCFPSNIYQTVASTEMLPKVKNISKQNMRLEKLMNEWNYDCTNPEEYCDTAQLHPNMHKKQVLRTPCRNSTILSQSHYGKESYSPVLLQTVTRKQQSKAVHLLKQTPIMYREEISDMKPCKNLPFSFSQNRGRYKRGDLSDELTDTDESSSKRTLDEVTCQKSSRALHGKQDHKESTKEKVKCSSEFHRNCVTPITVRIIKRLEKQKYKRLSPIRPKYVKRYPLSPKYRKPRTYVSAFRRKLSCMPCNTSVP